MDVWNHPCCGSYMLKPEGIYYCHNVEATKPVMFAQHLCQSLQPLWIHLYD